MTKYKEYIVSYNPVFKKAADLSIIYYNLINNDGYFAVCALNDYLYISIIASPADITDFSTNYLEFATVVQTKDDAKAYAIINESFSQKKFDIQSSAIYIGKAEANTLTSEAKWTIQKITLDVDGNPIAKNTTKQYLAIWDDRETEQYY